MFVIRDTRNGCSVGVAKRFGFHLLVLLRDLAFLCSENRCLSGSQIDVFELSVIDGLTTHCLDFSLLAPYIAIYFAMACSSAFICLLLCFLL